MTDKWIHYFGEAPEAQDPAELLGGKGASLSELFRAGFPVPPGFTITTAACRYFLQHETWPSGLIEQLQENLSRLERDTGKCFGAAPDPLLLAVRSGAAVSLPGMMDTILNCGLHPALAAQFAGDLKFWTCLANFIADYGTLVRRILPDAFKPPTQPIELESLRRRAETFLKRYQEISQEDFPPNPLEMLINCVNAVFRSWRSERAIAYRKRNCLSQLGGTAVNVQAMFPAEFSGVIFTRNALDPSAEEMVVEYSAGFGVALVSGSITPTRVRIRRRDLNPVENSANDEARRNHGGGLSWPEWLRTVCCNALQIEHHFGRAMDVEWSCLAEGRFAVLQARPIAELELACEAQKVRAEAVSYLRNAAEEERRVWIAHNLGETLRFPTPLTWDLTRRFMSGSGGVGLMYQDFGYSLSKTDSENGFLELVCGHIYADPHRIAQMFWHDLPLEYDLEALKSDPFQLGKPPTRLDAKKIDDRLLLKLPRILWTLFRVDRSIKRWTRRAVPEFEKEILPRYLGYVRQKREQDLRSLSTETLLEEFRQRCDQVLCQFARDALKPGFLGGLQFQALEATLARLFGPERGPSLARDLTAGLEDTNWRLNVDLGRAARGELLLDQWLDEYGHRGPDELELMEPRWREETQRLEQAISRLTSRTGRAAIYERAVRRREEAEQNLLQQLTDVGASSFYEDIKRQLVVTQALLPYREEARHYLMMGYELIRKVIVELGSRWELGDGVFFLQAEELTSHQTARLIPKEEIEARKHRWRSLRLINPPEVIDSLELQNLEKSRRSSDGERLVCVPLANGIATGRALVATEPDQLGYAGPDEIVVCPTADPAWLPALVNAAGLVVERGGALSHAAVAARNLGIPAVAFSDATRILIPGERLCLDAERGTITRPDRKL